MEEHANGEVADEMLVEQPEAEESSLDEATEPGLPEMEPKKGFFDLLIGLVIEPKKTMTWAAENPPFWWGFTVLMISALVNSIVSAFTLMYQPPVLPEGGGLPPVDFPAGAFGLVSGIGGFFGSIVAWFIMAGVFQLLAEFLGGRGRGLSVITALGLSKLPYIFYAPLQLLFLILPLPDIVSALIQAPLGLFFFIWAWVLFFYGLRSSHGLSSGKAVAVIVIPFVLLIMTLFFVIILTLAAAIPFLNALPIQ